MHATGDQPIRWPANARLPSLPHLGKIDVNVHLQGRTMRGAVSASQAVARQLLARMTITSCLCIMSH